ncbi:ABC transporter substrate-binding protein [Leptolyngbya sp. NK1-12]|uniref:ABC transporter substrate-binding protein n=1 Tax=Leptolyngbya sp. NK1-12 TaxID=2547451 RepID=A0AA97ANX6_9CYAN|nr:CmpA/NrtA family ABC transporter substrate-binding protein [Leptolyngbya sp. NK1-12]RNJ67949.1 MAG: ABC transporter substrate-binding protein [Leptolyngbya sp. IPPAS B-1204]WNZ27257.1 ABC transporter substrate-binding protein [Leptolyngbya sp. NK1-12]
MTVSTSASILVDAQCYCGGNHLPQDHWEFLESMPEHPADWISDLVKMGVYQPTALDLANTLTQVEMREALLLKTIGGGNLEREQFCRELIREAGGLDQAMAAAFGVNAIEFFSNTIRNGDYSRREFLKRVAVAGALIAMASCTQEAANQSTDTAGAADTPANLEKTDLKIGFIPITCATPIVMSEPLGFYKKHGLNVSVVKMPNWAAVRDSAIAGELDAYHMLSPMPIAITLGLGSTAFPIKLASIENINGQAITVAIKHKDTVKGPADFKGFKIGVPFPFSMHNLLLRYYLATGGLNPDTDVQIFPVPPPDSVAKMTAGEIDAMLMPDPFNQRAVYEKVGFIHMLTKELWDGHPCCAFAASQSWIDANPNTFRAVNKAIIDAAGHANDPANRKEIAGALIERKYLNQPLPVVEAVLTGEFEDGLGNTQNVPDRIGFDPYPWKSFAKWISSQLVRWELMPTDKANYDQIAQDIFLTDLAAELQKELGQTPPSQLERKETLKFDSLDPKNPAAYVSAQVKQFGK